MSPNRLAFALLTSQALFGCILADPEPVAKGYVPEVYGPAETVRLEDGETCFSALFQLTAPLAAIQQSTAPGTQLRAANGQIIEWTSGPLPQAMLEGDELENIAFALGVSCGGGIDNLLYQLMIDPEPARRLYFDVLRGGKTIAIIFPDAAKLLILSYD